MAPSNQPLCLYRGTVLSAWIDYNGHMSEGFYGVVFGEASDELLLHIGFDAEYRRQVGASFYTVETHIRFLRELAEGDPLAVETQVLGVDAKRVHLFHTLRHASSNEAAATQETMLLHVDTDTVVVTSMRSDLINQMSELAALHASLAVPEGAGQAVRSF